MATDPKKMYKYTDDDGTVMAVRLSASKAAFDGFQEVTGGEPLWPRPHNWIRHVGVRFDDGTRAQIPCKDTQGKYKQIGAKVNVTISGASRSGKIVGRTGERGGS